MYREKLIRINFHKKLNWFCCLKCFATFLMTLCNKISGFTVVFRQHQQCVCVWKSFISLCICSARISPFSQHHHIYEFLVSCQRIKYSVYFLSQYFISFLFHETIKRKSLPFNKTYSIHKNKFWVKCWIGLARVPTEILRQLRKLPEST